jgi:serine/threonine protein phosphatase PrpC
VSNYVKQRLPFIVSKELTTANKNLDEKMRTGLKNAFVKCHKELERQTTFDSYLRYTYLLIINSYSGTTCSTIYLYGNKLYVANAGDSRSLLISNL